MLINRRWRADESNDPRSTIDQRLLDLTSAIVIELMIMTEFDVIVIGCRARRRGSGVGGGAAGPQRRDLHAQSRNRRAHALQSRGWRHGEGTSGPRDRCAGRIDGSRNRRYGHTIQAAQSLARAGGVVAEGAGRQAALRRSGSGGALEAERNIQWIIGRAGRFLLNDGAISGLALEDGRTFGCRSLVITTGTFLNGLVHIGREQRPSGRAGEPPSRDLAESIKDIGFRWGRLKTGTPPRLSRKSIDFEDG